MTRRKNRARWGAVAAALVTASLATVAAPVANASYSECARGFSCVWTGANATGSVDWRGNGDYTTHYFPGGVVFNDSITTLQNKYVAAKVWYEDAGRGGVRFVLGRGDHIDDLTPRQTGRWYHPSWNDFISSVSD